ncbi:hypothetical protein N7474_005092 [Penicillium riverlandense]|uniref:uncharacterized protein n=1 Tax=Penicillium riverlandense TaxID=1903569 RepID=UPI0025468F07|nr:uncharacterized protein N7474_005092 [Penicillium riverlandense]KAJ5819501.1 hypothetical protein N7474_005092 [Penicillium riverlandense]
MENSIESSNGECEYPSSEDEQELREQLQSELCGNKSYEDSPIFQHQRTFSLSISSEYVKDWDSTCAFRELYQNWKDAIMETFDLQRLQFRPCLEDDDDFLSVKVPTSSLVDDDVPALGFIRYEKKTGRVIMVNACAQLQPEALELGHTSKLGNPKLAGCHGEGLKLAALVMTRNDYKKAESIVTDKD